MKNCVVVDLFAGAGGFSLGFKIAGFNIAVAIENFKPIAKTFMTNFPESTVIVDDIKNITGYEIKNIMDDHPDIVIGSPPCEPFTALNINRLRNPLDRLYRDPIGKLTLHFIRLVGELKPKIFIMENVPQIIEGGLHNALRKEFYRVGYKRIYYNILKAEDYGNPSRRTRIFVSNILIKPQPLHKECRVIDALRDLPDPRSIHNIPNHKIIKLPKSKIKKISRLKWGEALVHFKGADNKIYLNWVRLNPYKVAPSIHGKSRFIHPFEDRLLTVREQARLMGFPDNHIFYGGKEVQYDQVGEAVPIPLATAIAKTIRNIVIK